MVEKQQRIGERSLAEGCIHKDWRSIQAEYLKKVKSRRSAKRWIAQLIQKTWLVSWDMWDQRNAMVHNHTDTRMEQITEALHTEIQDIHAFANRHQFFPKIARRFFAQPMEEILQMTDYQ